MNSLRRAKPFISSFLRSPSLKKHTPNLNPHPSPPTRSFYTDPRYRQQQQQELQHFRRRGSGGSHHWYRDPRAAFAVTVVSVAGAVTVYYGNLETVPYTKRTHFILISPAVERQLGESEFEQLKRSLKPKILPSIHPDSVRVRLISKEIISALERGLHHGQDRRWSDLEYANHSDDEAGHPIAAVYGLEPKQQQQQGNETEDWGFSKEDEILDDKWVHESRKDKGGTQPATKHLEGLNWEILVVRDNMVNAFCLPGGKIVVFTGLLDHFMTDAEIATVIGHEVGHTIARHAAEGITKNLWVALLQLIILQFVYMPDLINAMSSLLLRFPFSRRMEMEADYIGILLLASAGYDPRVAPKVYEKLGQIARESSLQDYLATHPSSKKRAQLLSQAKVMDEALAIYNEAIAGRGVAGFL